MKKLIVSILIGVFSISYLLAEDCVMVKELKVEFKNDSTKYVDTKEVDKIKEFSEFLKTTDLYTIIEGHTSSVSNAGYNLDLSEKRAVKVRAELLSLGVEPRKVRAMGFGESLPLYDNNTQEGASKNRRVIAEVFNSAEELANYVNSQKTRISSIKYKEQ